MEVETKKMEVVTRIPIEIIIDILCRLPIKSLLRFRCVCKLWRSTISDSYFINLQLERARRDPKIIISFDQERFISLNFLIADKNGLPIHKWTNVVNDRVLSPDLLVGSFYHMSSSCNGLLCFFGGEGIYVCNPSTHQMKLLPKSTSGSNPLFDCGFGFDPSTKKYKVVKLAIFAPGSNSVLWVNLKCEILTLGSGSWRSIDMPPYPLVYHRSLFVSGKIHWKIGVSEKGYNQILSFDVGNEAFGVVPLPACFSARQWNELRMAELGGYLCLINKGLDDNGELMNLWILKDYDNHRWIKQSIPFSFEEFPLPVALQNEEVLLCICVGLDLRKFRSYNLQSKSWAELADLPEECLSSQSYLDSLIPLEMDPDPPGDDDKNGLRMQIRK